MAFVERVAVGEVDDAPDWKSLARTSVVPKPLAGYDARGPRWISIDGTDELVVQRRAAIRI